MKKYILLLLMLFSFTAQATILTDAKAIKWTSANLTALKALFNAPYQVTAFTKLLDPYDPDYPGVPKLAYPDACNFALVDLLNDGNIELVATMDHGGLGGCRSYYIIRQTGTAFSLQKIESIAAINFPSHIVDLNKDGKKELLIERNLIPKLDYHPVPFVADVYAWDGTKFSVANTKFKAYIQNTVIPELYAELDMLNKGVWIDPANSGYRAEQIDIHQKEIAAYRAILSQN